MPLIVPANEQGAGFMAAGYARASGKVGVCVVTSGPGATNTVTPVRDCAADSIPDRRHLRPGRHVRDRHRRVPGSARRQHHGCGRQALLPGHRSREARSDGAHRVRDRALGPPGSGRDRHPEGRPELGRAVPGQRPAAGARLPRAHAGAARPHARRRSCGEILPDARRSRTSADLRRRRRHPQRGGGRSCAPSRANSAFPSSPR